MSRLSLFSLTLALAFTIDGSGLLRGNGLSEVSLSQLHALGGSRLSLSALPSSFFVMVERRINLLCGDLDAGLEGRVSSFGEDLVGAKGRLSLWKNVDPGLSVLAGSDVMPGHEALVWIGGGRIVSGLNGLEHVVGIGYARKGVGVAFAGFSLEGSEDVVKSLGGGGDPFHHFVPGLGRFEHWVWLPRSLQRI